MSEPVRAAVATVSVTCIADGRAHAVRDTEIGSSTCYRSGYYSAVCGQLVTPASMVAPDGEICRECAERDTSHERRRRERHRHRCHG
jgi:hypothetical protein